ncbi:nucleotide-binding universal stress UspA family protein [Algoriphagus ratkowskyi]|uniref:Nucleotide-binding universal stress UspA family protein n=1 Tax=Algoriphagus ratkowskyi TaxID=57028 RepID=A0A2W7RNA6_9BACT|nr:universal stress protein [Algoriphagus ratkowskyi]PZX60456.1 nucleotide-binding universal stress UspA family protein [Algoriphagus ratkowskyi]TXD78261.1 universal stress protein [Algoriphagus ratkowskyi]
MKPLKNIGIFLDLSETDEFLLNYFKKLDDVFEFDSLTLIHFVALDSDSADLAALTQQLPKPLEEVLEDEVMELVEKVFGGKKSSIHIKIALGGKLDALIKWVDSQTFNMLVLGKKAKEEGTGVFSSKVIRLTDSDCLFVPEGAKTEFKSIVLALDFSDYSEKVIVRGLNLSKNLFSKLMPVHVLKAGFQYFPYFKNQEEYQKRLRTKAEATYKKIQKKAGLDEELICIEDSGNHISRSIHDFAAMQEANLIIIGNKGIADEDDLLIGSVAERLISAERKVPLLIVKPN